jgi:hypothetical protein
MKTKLLIPFIAILMMAVSSQAQQRWGGDSQRERIHDGWKSGRLNPKEMKQLSREQRRIHRTERHMYRDGRLSPAERHKLCRMNRHADRDIWRKKHN